MEIWEMATNAPTGNKVSRTKTGMKNENKTSSGKSSANKSPKTSKPGNSPARKKTVKKTAPSKTAGKAKSTSLNTKRPPSSRSTGKTSNTTITGQNTTITEIGTNPNITKVGTVVTSITSTNVNSKKKPRRPRNISPKSRTKAFLLGLFLGFLSAHRFYLKKPKTALIQLVVLYSGILLMQDYPGAFIFALWPVVDIILILTGSFKDEKGRKVKEW